MLSRWSLVAAGAVVAAAWYPWPAFGGGSADVAAIGGPTLAAAREDLSFQVRDRGRDLAWAGPAATWCEVAPAIDRELAGLDVGTVVVAVEEAGSCAGDPVRSARDAAADHGAELVAVVLPGQARPAGVPVVLAGTLLGDPGQANVPCEWWDAETCSADGTIAVRAPDGTYTDAALDRLARMIAATLG